MQRNKRKQKKLWCIACISLVNISQVYCNNSTIYNLESYHHVYIFLVYFLRVAILSCSAPDFPGTEWQRSLPWESFFIGSCSQFGRLTHKIVIVFYISLSCVIKLVFNWLLTIGETKQKSQILSLIGNLNKMWQKRLKHVLLSWLIQINNIKSIKLCSRHLWQWIFQSLE
jgi:hypothetical protein